MGVATKRLKLAADSALDWLRLRPLVPALAAFMLGILFSSRAELSTLHFLVLFVISSLAAAALAFFRRSNGFVPVVLSFFFLGALFITPLARPVVGPEHIIHLAGKRGAVLVEGVVSNMPEKGSGVVRLYLDAYHAHEDGAWRPASGRMRLVMSDDEETRVGPGDIVRVSAKLSRPRNLSNPGGFDYEWWLGRRGVLVTGYVKDGDNALVVEAAGGVRRLAWSMKERVEREIYSTDLKHSAIIAALVTGAREKIPDDIEEAFRRTGTTHILSISGLHVGVVAWVSYMLSLAILRRSERLMLALNVKKLATAFSLAPVFLYAAVSGFSVSTQRAVVMVAAYVAVRLMGRGRDFFGALALAAFAVLVASPGALWEPSFQLSFAAVLGMAIVAPVIEGFFEREPDPFSVVAPKTRFKLGVDRVLRYFAALFVASLSASLATAPITAYHFNSVSLLGIVANVVAVPLMGFAAVVTSLAGAMLSTIGHAPAYAAFVASNVFIEAACRAIEFMSAVNKSSAWMESPAPVVIVLYYLFMAAFVVAWRAWRPVYALVFPALMVAGSFFLYERSTHGTSEVTATFLSVGQSEATVVEFPGGETMLVDGGGGFSSDFDVGERVVAPFLRNRGISRIDYMVLSHAQRDHMAGLSYIADNFEVGEFWWPGVGDLKALGPVLSEKGIKTRVINGASPGREIGNASIEFLNPAPGYDGEVNDGSLVMRLAYGARALLFTGDVGEGVERALSTRHGDALRADVLKAPHHGSRYSSSQEFLERVGPSIVIVSAGYKNGFGFPHAETLGRYAAAGARVFRTDLDGAITVAFDGEDVRADSYLTGNKSKSILKIKGIKENPTPGESAI